MTRGAAGLGLSLALHAVFAAVVLFLWPEAAPVPEQAGTPTEMRMGVMQVETRRASAEPPEAPPAGTATPSAPRRAGQGVPTRRSPAVEGAAKSAEAVAGGGAPLPAVPGRGREISGAPPPSEQASPVQAPPARARAADPAAARAHAAWPEAAPGVARAPVSVAVSLGALRAEAMVAEQAAAAQAPVGTAPSPKLSSLRPPAPTGASEPVPSVTVSPDPMPTQSGPSIEVAAAAQAPLARASSVVAPSLAPASRAGASWPLAPFAAAQGRTRPALATTMRPAAEAAPEAASTNAAAPPVAPRVRRRDAAEPEVATVVARAAETAAAPPGALQAGIAARVSAPAPALAGARPVPTRAPSARPRAATLRPDAARPAPASPAIAVGAEVSTLRIDAPDVGASALSGRKLTAALDWSGAGALQLDAGGLATLRAFLTPEAASGRAVRDGMAAALQAPDCARLRTVFDPETGALALRGHVPEAAAAAPLIAALREEIGETLPLRDELRVLPDPQCSLLDGLDGLGLPQSEEQLTDPNHVGEAAFVREYDFTEGDLFVVDLTTPDYPAYLYVDYFDSTGQVLHLTPNAALPLAFHPPATPVTIGRGDALRLRIAPPFGQDIVVAFAASRPLYEGLRPTAEPAEPYLDWLRGRVAARRAADPAFKGEWVYLFVASRAAPD